MQCTRFNTEPSQFAMTHTGNFMSRHWCCNTKAQAPETWAESIAGCCDEHFFGPCFLCRVWGVCTAGEHSRTREGLLITAVQAEGSTQNQSPRTHRTRAQHLYSRASDLKTWSGPVSKVIFGFPSQDLTINYTSMFSAAVSAVSLL